MTSPALNLSTSATTLFETLALASAEQHRVDSTAGTNARFLAEASEANRMALLALNLVEVGGTLLGVDPGWLQLLKVFELLPRAAACYIEFQKHAQYPAYVDGNIGRCLNSACVMPIVDLIKCCAEASTYHQLSNLGAHRRGEAVMRTLYSGDVYDEYRIPIGSTPVSQEETLAFLQEANDHLKCVLKARLLVDDSIQQHALSMGKTLYEAAIDFYSVLTGRVRSVNLRDLDFIPPIFYDDAVFRRYICPLTGRPIRHPVSLQGQNLVYERSAAIEQFGIENLRERPAIAAEIDARLKWHEEHIQETLENYQPPPREVAEDEYVHIQE